jgi:hypothetical protein
MGLDPLWAILLGIVIPILVHLYLRYVATNVVRSPDFERYCAGRPLVLALLCSDDAGKVLDRLRSLLDPRGRVDNFRGVNPWPHYRYRVELRRVGEHVVGVYLAGCAPRRGDRPPLTELSTALARMLESPDERIDQFWVHSQFYPGDPPADAHSEEGWQGRLDEERGLLLSRGPEPPLWLRPALEPSPRSRCARAPTP